MRHEPNSLPEVRNQRHLGALDHERPREDMAMSKLWERFIGVILLVALLPMAVSVGIGLLEELARALGSALWQLLSETGPWAVLMVLFVVGAAARVLGQGRGDVRALRERRAEERFVRQSVRRPASDVPLPEQTSHLDDDPALNELDDEEEP